MADCFFARSRSLHFSQPVGFATNLWRWALPWQAVGELNPRQFFTAKRVKNLEVKFLLFVQENSVHG
jgi:hypothetical protein